LEEEQAIRELDPTAHLALQHNQLTSERGILSLKPADRPERRNQQPQKEEEQRDHRGRRYVIPSSDQTDEVFGIHRMSRLPTQPAAGTVRSRRTRSTCKGRSSAASISRFAVAVSRFEFAVGTGI
jgi:hypothetical protein